MTNGGGPHGPKAAKKSPEKKRKPKTAKAALQRKGWLPSGADKAKGSGQ